MRTLKPINTSVYDFPTLIQKGCVYVDKTAQIYEICTSETAFPSLEFVESNKLVYEFIDHFDDKISGKMTKGLVDFYNKITASGLPIHFLASARNLQRTWRRKIGKSVMYVPNGVDEAHYSKENIAAITGRVKLPECLTGSRPKIGYFGALAPWLDYKMLNDVIVAHPEWDFIFCRSMMGERRFSNGWSRASRTSNPIRFRWTIFVPASGIAGSTSS